MTGPYAVWSTTENTVTIGKDGVAIPVSFDRVTKRSRVCNGAEPTAGVHNIIGQPASSMQRVAEESVYTSVRWEVNANV